MSSRDTRGKTKTRHIYEGDRTPSTKDEETTDSEDSEATLQPSQTEDLIKFLAKQHDLQMLQEKERKKDEQRQLDRDMRTKELLEQLQHERRKDEELRQEREAE